ncbi:MAG: acylphosphatase [bacterium]|nr:acylphosphatase [bacterium]
MDNTRAYRITGMVQGVGFRYFTRNQARSLELSGWVCNRGDGSVEVHVRGDNQTLDKFEGVLREGPESSHVDEIKRLKDTTIPDAKTFEIRFG